MHKNAIFCAIAGSAALATFAILSGCNGGGNSMVAARSATVNISLSDPAPCASPQGPFSHVYVTITDVQINASATAGGNDPGWIDLTPGLKQNPKQVDLLGQASNQCFLAMLGSATELQPGSYQQLRLFLGNNATVVASNVCGSTANCVMLSSDVSNTPQPLLLSSEAQTGLKIPSGQIAGGKFEIAAGETKDLNIDFDVCSSIVAQGNGQFRLKPVLHSGEVSLTSSSINGKIVDSATGQPISGGTTIVALEQPDGSGVDRVVMQTLADSTGAFTFCPVTPGTYDVVAVAVDGSQVAYGATVITGVQSGNSLGIVPLVAESGANKSPASITGQVTTTTGSAGTAADISISALQSISVNSSAVLVTIPLVSQATATANITTASGASCPAKTDCATYTLSVPALNPSFGAFSSSGTQTPAPPASGTVGYTIDARATVTGGGSTDCSPSDLQTSSTSTNTPLVATAGQSSPAATLAFTGCQ